MDAQHLPPVEAPQGCGIGNLLAIQLERLKALLISGHAEILHAGNASGVPLLAKPFKVAELRRRIAETLFASSVDADLGVLNSRAVVVPG